MTKGEGATKKVISLTQNVSLPIFLQLKFCCSVSHDILVILQWATKTRSRGCLYLLAQPKNFNSTNTLKCSVNTYAYM